MTLKRWIYLIAIIVGLVIWLIQSTIDIIAGCDQSMLDRFEQTRLAREYGLVYEEFLYETENVTTFKEPESKWTIHKQGNGCVAEYSVTFFNVKRTTYIGDKFFIDLDSLKIRPLTEGAELFMELSDVSNKLP